MRKKTQPRTQDKPTVGPTGKGAGPASARFFDDRVVLDLSLRVYPLEAVYSASYVFAEHAWILLDQEVSGRVLVQLKPRSRAKAHLDELAADFSSELLKQALRLKIAKRTARVREMLVGRALLAAEPLTLDPQQEERDDDYLADPLGIAVPWEERFGEEPGDGNPPEPSGVADSDSKGTAT